MVLIKKQRINGNRVINEEIIGYFDVINANQIADRLKALVDLYNYKATLLNDNHKVKFIITKVKADDINIFNWISDNITTEINTLNNYIKCANNVAIKSAKLQNADKVYLIKEINKYDYLYPIRRYDFNDNDEIVVID